MNGIVAEVGLQDGLGIDDVFWFICGLAATVTALGVLLRPIYWRAKSFLNWWEKFARDWDGEEESPGRMRIPGVMERLNNIDGELKRNGGSSMKDQVCSTHRTVDWLSEQVAVIEERQREIRDLTMATSERLDAHIHGPGISQTGTIES
jgi:hypothetical protein